MIAIDHGGEKRRAQHCPLLTQDDFGQRRLVVHFRASSSGMTFPRCLVVAGFSFAVTISSIAAKTPLEGDCGELMLFWSDLESRPMDIVLAWALVILIVGCVVGYSVRATTASTRPAEPRRRRPF
jgi:formate hydrogenlyase subunit 3/multisubunit Na+/H+ antiporter MnhD subunit